MNLTHSRRNALDLARTVAWRARIIRLRGQQIRVLTVPNEDGRYAPALIVDATTEDLDRAEQLTARLNRDLIDQILDEMHGLDAPIQRAEASQ